MADSSKISPVGRHDSTLLRARRAALSPLPLLVRIHGAVAHPNPARLLDGHCIIGAGGEADIIIESDAVSRRHVELRLVAEGAHVTDLGSKNGAYYLGQRFESMILQPGSRFRLGTVEIQLELDTQSHARRAPSEVESYADLIGVSPAMRKLFGQLVRLESSSVNVLVRGESGTGKELIARAIHEHSPVGEGPFVAVNCGALERNLVRSELFGHSRGAFTGATERRTGAFEAANGGSLFLDEIGELPIDVQPILLRALETRTITPVGTHNERAVNVRLIAATHKDLVAEASAGTFRDDLLYRVRVVCIEVPPLRERLEDIPALANEFARRQGAAPLPSDFIDALAQHGWPGNVRELRNAVEAYLAIGDVPLGTPASSHGAGAEALELALAAFVDPTRSYADQKAEVARRFSEAYVRLLLEHTGGNQSQAARLCGLERRYLGRLIDKLGLKTP